MLHARLPSLTNLALGFTLCLVLPACDDGSGGGGGDFPLLADPESVDFGYVDPLAISGAREIVLSNSGDTNVLVESIRLENSPDTPFSLIQVPAQLPVTVQSGATETISVNFAPIAADIYGDSILITTDADADGPMSIHVGGAVNILRRDPGQIVITAFNLLFGGVGTLLQVVGRSIGI